MPFLKTKPTQALISVNQTAGFEPLVLCDGIEPPSSDYKSLVLAFKLTKQVWSAVSAPTIVLSFQLSVRKYKLKGKEMPHCKCVVESAGVEPTPTGSKPVVLPLHNPTI